MEKEAEAPTAELIILDLPMGMRNTATEIWMLIKDHVTIMSDATIQYYNPPLRGSSLLHLFKATLTTDPAFASVPFDFRRFIRTIYLCNGADLLDKKVKRTFAKYVSS